MMKYDPDRTPSPEAWLALDEGERIEQVSAYHRQLPAKLPNARLRAAFHVVVESQLAAGVEVVRQTLGRLKAEGLNRHEAMPGIGSVLAKPGWSVARKEGQEAQTSELYFQALWSVAGAQIRANTALQATGLKRLDVPSAHRSPSALLRAPATAGA